ncbi:MAG: hypothetical protein ACPG47_10590 [Leucothrix sp.]
MEYLLITAFIIGLLLFVLSWLRVVFAGFGHHFVTGIVSAIPVINLLVLPSLWHKVYAWVLAGIIGLLVAVGCWYSGADQHVYRYAYDAGINVPAPQQTSQTEGHNLDFGKSKQTTTVMDSDTPAIPLPSGKELPKNALYRMSYQKVDANKLGQYAGRYVRLTRIDRKKFEGKVLGADDKGIIIERRVNGGVIEQKVNFSDITESEVMSKK